MHHTEPDSGYIYTGASERMSLRSPLHHGQLSHPQKKLERKEHRRSCRCEARLEGGNLRCGLEATGQRETGDVSVLSSWVLSAWPY